MKRFRLVLVDDGNPLGADWHALDENGDTICRSFGKWIAQENAEAKGYTLAESGLGCTLYDLRLEDFLVNPELRKMMAETVYAAVKKANAPKP